MWRRALQLAGHRRRPLLVRHMELPRAASPTGNGHPILSTAPAPATGRRGGSPTACRAAHMAPGKSSRRRAVGRTSQWGRAGGGWIEIWQQPTLPRFRINWVVDRSTSRGSPPTSPNEGGGEQGRRAQVINPATRRQDAVISGKFLLHRQLLRPPLPVLLLSSEQGRLCWLPRRGISLSVGRVDSLVKVGRLLHQRKGERGQLQTCEPPTDGEAFGCVADRRLRRLPGQPCGSRHCPLRAIA